MQCHVREANPRPQQLYSLLLREVYKLTSHATLRSLIHFLSTDVVVKMASIISLLSHT